MIIRIGNAAGICKTPQQTIELLKSSLTDVTVGSITKEMRIGNGGNTFYYHKDGAFALNSLGMPNPGMAYWKKNLPDILRIAGDLGKALRFNIAGFNAQEFSELAYDTVESGCRVIELNFGCPNIITPNGPKPIIAFNPDLVLDILETVWLQIEPVQVKVKISPYEDPMFRRKMIMLLLEHPGVDGIVCCNTLPDAFFGKMHDGKLVPVIDPNDGYAGMSGDALFPTSLAHVRMAHALRMDIDPNFEIAGAGGVKNASTLLAYDALQANLIQIGAFLYNNPVPSKAVQEIMEDLAELLAT